MVKKHTHKTLINVQLPWQAIPLPLNAPKMTFFIVPPFLTIFYFITRAARWTFQERGFFGQKRGILSKKEDFANKQIFL